MKNYIIAWTITHTDGNSDHYKVILGDEPNAEQQAYEVYQEKLTIYNLYSASLCEIIKSTDY